MVLWWLWCSSPFPFWVGVVQVRVWWLAYVVQVGGETQSQKVALELTQLGALLVELVDIDTTPGSPK